MSFALTHLNGFGSITAASSAFGTVRTDALTGSTGGNATVTFRHQFAAAGLTAPSGTVTQTRVTFHAGTTAGENLTITDAYIGHKGAGDAYDFAATPVQITFDGGNAGVTITTDTTKVSDAVNFAWDKTSDIVISTFYNTSGADACKNLTGLSNVNQYTKVANDAATVDATGYSGPTAGRIEAITKIETDGF